MRSSIEKHRRLTEKLQGRQGLLYSLPLLQPLLPGERVSNDGSERPDPQVAPDGIVMLPGCGDDGIDAVSKLSQDYSKARLTFCGFSVGGKDLMKRLVDLGVDPGRINTVPQSRTTSEDAYYSAALLKPKPSEKWLLITAAMHMPRAFGSFRAVGFRVQPYPVEFITRGRAGPFALFATGSSALIQFDRAAKEWIGPLVARSRCAA
jgi:uncharacterized SAM-binding protein YcdF (DUF218 family)